MVLMANRYILPAALLPKDSAKSPRGGGQGCRRQRGTEEAARQALEDHRRREGQPITCRICSTRPRRRARQAREALRDKVPAMTALREAGDALETLVPQNLAAADVPRDAVHEVGA